MLTLPIDQVLPWVGITLAVLIPFALLAIWSKRR